ncbi:unnamed protein product, partial [Polarella glacialis]
WQPVLGTPQGSALDQHSPGLGVHMRTPPPASANADVESTSQSYSVVSGQVVGTVVRQHTPGPGALSYAALPPRSAAAGHPSLNLHSAQACRSAVASSSHFGGSQSRPVPAG